MKKLLLGGYGSFGYDTPKILLNRKAVEVLIAGHSPEKAQFAAAKLIEETNKKFVSGLPIDAFNYTEVFPAISLAACMIQVLERDSFSQMGINPMGHFLNADKFPDDKQDIAMEVMIEHTHTENLKI